MSAETHVRVKPVSPPPSVTPVSRGLLQRKCACGGSPGAGGECADCRKKQLNLQRKEAGGRKPAAVPPIVGEVLRSPGRSLDEETRSFMESRLGHDFSRVRVHTDSQAAESARAVSALAYTVGRDVVFGEHQYTPGTHTGRRLLAHELAHVVQQGGVAGWSAPLALEDAGSVAEREADRIASSSLAGTAPEALKTIAAAEGSPRLQKQTSASSGGSSGSSPSGSSGSSGGDCDEPYVPPPATGFRVCSRSLQSIAGLVANHAYVEAPGARYAIITRCTPTSGRDNVLFGTAAAKTDRSPDPCCKEPACVDCVPKPGVTDLGTCLSSAFSSYADPSFYRALGPNSNTFAGTLARACCDNMAPKPAALGTVPGWDDAPASGRAATCPPGPARC